MIVFYVMEDVMKNVNFSGISIAERTLPKIADWLWRPLRAKIWWAAIPFYWVGMAASLHIEILADFYHSALAGVTNVFFFPPIAGLILSFGYFRILLERSEPGSNDGTEEYLEWRRKRYGPSGMLREFDPLDPASGAMWVGNPLNPLNPGYINRHSS